MIRFLLIIFIILCSQLGFAKNYITNDNVNTDGFRTVISKDETLYTSNGGFMTKHGLVATVSPDGSTTLFLKIRFNGNKMTMDEGSALLLKLGNGTTLELKSNKVGPMDYDFVATGIGSTYFVNALYEITEDLIQQIIENDVVKIRVQWTGGTFDKDIKKQKMSKHLSNVYPAIKETLSKEKSLYDGF